LFFLFSYYRKLNKYVEILELPTDDKVSRTATVIHSFQEELIKLIPTFIYMSDYRDFTGSTRLDELQQRIGQKKETQEDKTIRILIELAGLSIEQEVKRGNEKDREERIYDLRDASVSLTKEIENRWKQRKYEIEFQADGQEFYTIVSEEKKRIPIRLEEHSKGFQWFFSFDLMFMYESQGTFKDCIILLDEPGLHLHPDGQKDLLERLKQYANENIVIFSTHLPFMIDLHMPETIRILSEKENTVQVSEDFVTADPEARLVLQTALGISGSSSYLLSQKNLIVEGVDDYWFIAEISNIFNKSNKENGLDSDIFITPAGGCSEAVYIATIMIGQKLNAFVLLDNDTAGQIAKSKLIKNWLTKYNETKSNAKLLNEILDLPDNKNIALEDIFPVDYYLDKVRETYKRELLNIDINESKLHGNGLIVNKVETFFDTNSLKFNKGSVAKRIKEDLIKKNFDELPTELIENFKKIFKTINNFFNDK